MTAKVVRNVNLDLIDFIYPYTSCNLLSVLQSCISPVYGDVEK